MDPKLNGTNSRIQPEDWDTWPTATGVAIRLGVSRQWVYKLERSGKIRSYEGVYRGKKLKRFDPSSIDSLTPDVLEEIEDDETTETAHSEALRLAARTNAELLAGYTKAVERAEGAYELMRGFTKQFVDQILAHQSDVYGRMGKVEEQLHAMHDAARDARREDREHSLLEATIEREQARKDAAWEALKQHGPALLNQVVESFARGKQPPPEADPVREWFARKSAAEQAETLAAFETFIQIAREEKEASHG